MFLFAQAAAAECLTPAWEVRSPLSPAGTFTLTTAFDDCGGDPRRRAVGR